MTIGERIRERRKARGLTLQQVGDQFGINRASVSDWENDKTRPDLDRLVVLARTLGTSLDYLLAGRESNAEKWPFSANFSRYQALTADQKARLNEKVTDFLDGALPSKRNGSAA
ncbi:MAG: helix-turn-helix domain-containing protein [Pigmentiphaga sp.]